MKSVCKAVGGCLVVCLLLGCASERTYRGASSTIKMPPKASAQTVTVTRPAPSVAATPPPQAVDGGAVRRTHLQFATDEAVREFVTLATRRQSGEDAQRVLSQLIVEKQGELQVFDAQLREKFGVDPDKKYQFDPESKALYELVVAPAATAAPGTNAVATAGIDRQLRRQFDDDIAAREFLQVLTAKQVTTQELDTLRLLLREKQIEHSQTQQALNTRYSMVPERDYQFDRDSRTLYELVPMPTSASMPAAAP